jgi:aquaporin Z
MAVQFLGAFLGALLASALFKGEAEVTAAQLSVGPALVGEILFTFLLVWVIMNVATAKAVTGNQFYGIAIGFTVIAAIYTVGETSLAVLNPAVAVALTMVGKLSLSQIWLPIAGSLIGATSAVVFFNFGHPSESCSESDESSCRPIDGK